MVLLDRYDAFRDLDEQTVVHPLERHPDRGGIPALYQWRS